MVWLLATLGCVTDDWQEPPPPAPVVPGAPVVGAAEGYLVLPVGTPLSGFTARCTCLGGYVSQVDDRDSSYTTSFIESAGVQTYPNLKSIWIENGDDQLVITKTDSIYSADALVGALTERLEAATGLDLKGKVVLTANHSHSSYGDYAPGITWFLGSDKFNREIFERFADQLAVVALEAYDNRQPAKIGVGWAKDWDPNDEVYRDRRGVNNDLVMWDDVVLGKDPHLGIIRFDTLDDKPLAMMMNFGMHGIIGDVDNPFVSGDSGGGLETVIEESFDDKVVVMFAQGSAGDASPAGSQDWFARTESIGEIAKDKILAVYDQVETSADPISLQTASRHIWKHPSVIQVTRDGTVDWHYAPYDEDRLSDGQVYESDGSLIPEIDEFNTQNGAVFCGSGDLDFPVGGLEAVVFPYDQCMQVDLLSSLIDVFFQLDGNFDLPLIESLKAGTTASRIGPVPTMLPDGTRATQDLFVGFFPGEPVYSFGEQWRRRVTAELGYVQPMIIGYSQDHEGYMLPPEDWLMGGYEPDITVWGPLEAEHVMENVIAYSAELLSNDVHDDPDPLGHYAPTVYPEVELPTARPDLTPEAGTRITTDRPYLWTPYIDTSDEEAPQSPTAAELTIPAQVPRVQGQIQIAWEGGDPMIDAPKVMLERDVGGSWEPVRSHTGRVVDEGRHDILVAHTPTPLYPADAEQTHQWWATWQAVGHVHDRAGLPLGTYRLHITGQRYTGQASTWPWDGEPYELFGEEFEVVPGELVLTEDAAGLLVSIPAPATGFRFVAMGGDNAGDNPVPGTITVSIDTGLGVETQEIETEPALPRSLVPITLPGGWVSVTVTDEYGNMGTLVAP